jgi:hypothetical protein
MQGIIGCAFLQTNSPPLSEKDFTASQDEETGRLLFLFPCLNKVLSRHGEREIGPEVLA